MNIGAPTNNSNSIERAAVQKIYSNTVIFNLGEQLNFLALRATSSTICYQTQMASKSRSPL